MGNASCRLLPPAPTALGAELLAFAREEASQLQGDAADEDDLGVCQVKRGHNAASKFSPPSRRFAARGEHTEAGPGAAEARLVPFQDLLRQFREQEVKVQQGSTLADLQQVMKGMVRHVEDLEHRAESAEAALQDAEQRLAAEVKVRLGVERERAQAAQRVEELELSRLVPGGP